MLDDWESIGAPRGPSGLNVLRADPAHPLDFRIGRDERGRFAFQLDAAGPLQPTDEPASPGGIDVLLDDLGDRTVRMTLVLHDGDDLPIFRVLCGDLLDATRDLAPADAHLARGLVLRRLGQWQEVLARRRRRRLSRNEALGLFGELVFLRDVLSGRNGLPGAVTAWRGPYGDEQDFALPGAIVEVKTQGATADARLMISSEHQLDTSSVAIFVCRQRVGERTADAGGESLDQVATALIAATADLPVVSTRLRTGLEAAGWSEAGAHTDRWVVEHRSYYRVEDGFPRITGADLVPGVERVKYQVLVSSCAPFAVDESSVFADRKP